MKAYWIVIFIMIIVQLIPSKTKLENKCKLIISLSVLFVYGAIRMNYGLDYKSYEYVFDEVNVYGSNDHVEIGFLILNKLCPSYRFLIIFLTAFSCFTLFWFIDSFVPVKYRWMVFFIIGFSGQNLIFFQFSAIRNAVSINILCLSFYLLRDKKILPYILMSLLAISFHSSSILIMPFVYIFSLIKKQYVSIGLISIIMLILFQNNIIVDYVFGNINEFIERYSTYTEIDKSLKINFLTYFFVVLNVLILLWILLKENLSKNGELIIRLSILFVFAPLLGPLNYRISQWLAIYNMALPFVVLKESKNKKLNMMFLCMYFFQLFYSIYWYIYKNEYFTYWKYTTIFDDL